MGTPLPQSFVPYSPSNFGLRTCPSCKERFARTKEFWGRQTVVRQHVEEDDEGNVISRTPKKMPTWSTYCLTCQRKKNRDAARVRRALAKLSDEDQFEISALRRGPCACCGLHRNRRVIVNLDDVGMGGEKEGDRVIMCELCSYRLLQCRFSLPFAKQAWVGLKKHIAREEALDAEVAKRSPGRRRQWHEENPEVGPDSPEHIECIWSEKAWKPVVKWLAKQSLSTNPT